MQLVFLAVMTAVSIFSGVFISGNLAPNKVTNLDIPGPSNNEVDLATPTPRPTVIPTTKPVTKKVSPNIDCVGPDGVHFQTSQKECDDFNQAWANAKPEFTPQPKAQLTNLNTSDYVQYPDCEIDGFTYHYLSPSDCKTEQEKMVAIKNTTTTYEPKVTSQDCTTVLAETVVFGDTKEERDQNCSDLQKKHETDLAVMNSLNNQVNSYPGSNKCNFYSGSAREACLALQ